MDQTRFRYRTVDRPRGDRALRAFSAGSQRRYDVEVNAIIEELVGGEASSDVRVIAVEDDQAVAGVVGYAPRQLLPGDESPDAVYIAFLAVDAHYRGRRLPTGETLGNALLAEALERIAEEAGGNTPPVWALVERDNEASRRLLRRHGFASVSTGPSDDWEIEYRPAGLPPTHVAD
jgi:ribosomal protein S18 acetylase RimI-like enzyme